MTAGLGGEFGPEVARAFLALDRADAVPRFSREAFSRALFDAAEHLLPSAVSPLSNNQLLTIVANLIDAKDPYTGGHSRRVAMLAVAVADELRLDADLRSHLWAVGYLHDLGKVAVPLRVLAKTSGLSTEELALIRAHPGDGARILQEVEPLQQLTTGVRHHHERWDGRGYPDGLSGHRIPLIAQVIAVCDAYDAMTSRRAYRDSLDPEFARCEVERQSGRQFGPTVAEAFLAVPGETLERIQGMRPPAIADFREPVQALRRIDPRWLGPSPVGDGLTGPLLRRRRGPPRGAVGPKAARDAPRSPVPCRGRARHLTGSDIPARRSCATRCPARAAAERALTRFLERRSELT